MYIHKKRASKNKKLNNTAPCGAIIVTNKKNSNEQIIVNDFSFCWDFVNCPDCLKFYNISKKSSENHKK